MPIYVAFICSNVYSFLFEVHPTPQLKDINQHHDSPVRYIPEISREYPLLTPFNTFMLTMYSAHLGEALPVSHMGQRASPRGNFSYS